MLQSKMFGSNISGEMDYCGPFNRFNTATFIPFPKLSDLRHLFPTSFALHVRCVYVCNAIM